MADDHPGRTPGDEGFDRPPASERERAEARDVERSAERKRAVAEARGHERSTGVAATAAGDPVVEHTGFRLSWGGIFAGLIVVLVLQMFFMLIGIAVGFGIWDPAERPEALGIGLGVWVAFSSLLALFLGGMTAGRMAGVLTPGDGAIHGVLVWGVSMIVTLWLVASGVTGLLGGTLDLATSPVAAEAAQQVDPAEAEDVGADLIEQLEAQAERIDPEVAAARTAEAAGWSLLAMALGVLAAAGGGAWMARK